MKKHELEDKINKLLKEKKSSADMITKAQMRNTEIMKQVKELRKQLWNYDHNGGFELSDHAIVRYLERYKNINIDELHQELYSKIEPYAKDIKDGDIDCGEFKARIRDFTVVTIIY